MSGAGTSWVGQPFRRVDAFAKVTGKASFADDLRFPRMAYLKLVRSTCPHGRILSIDLTQAEAVPGVLGFLTGRDLPVPFGILPVSQDEHALALEVVRHVGEPVVAVAAVSEDAAEEAALAVRVEYEPLPTISSIEEALATPEPQLHRYADRGNLHKVLALDFGEVDAAFARATHVFEDVFYYEGNTHLPLEQHATVAVPEDGERLTVYSSTQTPHYLHRALVKVLGLPASRVRVIACPNGGGFGGKSDPFGHEIVCAAMSRKLGRPVKITLTREEVFWCHRGRHPVWMKLRTALDAEGKLLGQELFTLLDGGAYGSYGVASTYYTGALQTVTYRLPTYRFRSVRAFTNKPPCGPKRGHGTPQPRFGWEVHLDRIAVALGKNPADLRLQNLEKDGAITANWWKLGTIDLRRAIETVVQASGYRERWSRLPEGRGLGLACGAYLCGAGLPIYWNQMPQSAVILHVDRGGGVSVFSGATEIGQGSDSVLAAIVAEALGLELSDLTLCVADTALTPVDLGSYSSRVTLMMGHAARQAALEVRKKIALAVAKQLETTPDDLEFASRKVFSRTAPEKCLAWEEAVVVAEAQLGTLTGVGSYTPPRAPGRYRGSGVGPSPTYSYTAAVVEVEVDPETGIWRPLEVWIAHDIGKAINPALALGQIEGSIYMGLGEAMMEESAFRRLPRSRSNALLHKFPSLLEYKSPTFHEMPKIHAFLLEREDPEGPFGAKEVGQGPLLPIPPACANAIFDAVGVRVDQVPIHPHLVQRALEAKKRGRPARVGPPPLPSIDYGFVLEVPTPWEGGDGRARNEEAFRQATGRRSPVGTMLDREQALAMRTVQVLTTALSGKRGE